MKQIDRYVLRGFLIRFIASHLIVFGLYVSFDALKRIDQIQKGSFGETAPRILAFYAYQFPTSILDTVPPLLLLGAGLVLVQMARDGELLTLKSSGVSLRRVALPIFLCAIPVVALVFWTRDNVVPWAFRQQELLDHELDEATGGPFILEDRRSRRMFFVDSYDYAAHTMWRVCVMEFHPDGSTKKTIEADTGRWMGKGKIHLETVSIQEFEPSGAAAGKPRGLATEQIETSLVPYDFVRAKRDVMATRLLAFRISDLREMIAENPCNPLFRVTLQSRLAAPFVPFVLLLIGIPLLIGFEHTMHSRVLAAIVCILVTAGFHVLSFIFVNMGNTDLIPPLAAVWFPPGLAGVVGLWLFSSMHT